MKQMVELLKKKRSEVLVMEDGNGFS